MKNIISILFIVILALPTTLQFLHLNENHQKEIECNDSSLHFHQSNCVCELCDFHLLSLNYDFIRFYVSLSPPVNNQKKIKFDPQQFHHFTLTNTLLRGPPVLT
ncbi:MAG: hypothetical protein VW080_11585 [Flavobacteriaceae bacterium]